jgi:hypothetical protein
VRRRVNLKIFRNNLMKKLKNRKRTKRQEVLRKKGRGHKRMLRRKKRKRRKRRSHRRNHLK